MLFPGGGRGGEVALLVCGQKIFKGGGEVALLWLEVIFWEDVYTLLHTMTQDRPTQWWGKFTQVEWGAYFIHNGGGVGAHYIGGELTKLGYIGGGGGEWECPPSHYGEPCISGKWNLRKRNTFESVELQSNYFKTLFAKPTKCSSILKQIDGCCRRIAWVCLTTLLG